MQDESSNPWLSIWVRPKQTMVKILRENPNRSLWLLASVYGFSSLLNFFQSISLGAAASILPLFVIAILFAPIWGYIFFAIWSSVVWLTGKIFKGQGSYQAIRSAYAWSCVPFVCNIPLWILMVLVFGQQLFLNFPEGQLLNDMQVTILFGILIAKILIAVWSLVIYLNTLAVAQQFGIFRSILNVLIAALLIGFVTSFLWGWGVYSLGESIDSSKAAFQLFNEGSGLENGRGSL